MVNSVDPDEMDGSLLAISSGPTLFAKVFFLVYRVKRVKRVLAVSCSPFDLFAYHYVDIFF